MYEQSTSSTKTDVRDYDPEWYKQANAAYQKNPIYDSILKDINSSKTSESTSHSEINVGPKSSNWLSEAEERYKATHRDYTATDENTKIATDIQTNANIRQQEELKKKAEDYAKQTQENLKDTPISPVVNVHNHTAIISQNNLGINNNIGRGGPSISPSGYSKPAGVAY